MRMAARGWVGGGGGRGLFGAMLISVNGAAWGESGSGGGGGGGGGR